MGIDLSIAVLRAIEVILTLNEVPIKIILFAIFIQLSASEIR